MASHFKPDPARFGARTRLVLAGRDKKDSFGFVNPPMVRGSTVQFANVEDFAARRGRFVYGTHGTPTTEALEAVVNNLHGGAGSVLAPSGLVACTGPLLAFLAAGDHMLVPDNVYRPTRNFSNGILKRMGVETTFYEPSLGGDIAGLIRPNTKVIFTEAPGSQTMEMQDVPAIAAAAHARGAIVMMDNTWATPLFFDSHRHGVDIDIQAGTKYLGGHSDILLGTVSARTPEQFKILSDAWHQLGICIAPEDAFLAMRGSRTLAVRLKEHQKSGLEMAEWFEKRPEVARVLYPPLPSHPGHALWKRDFAGASSLMSIVLKPASRAAVAAMIDGLELFGIGASWGGYESLALPFDCSDYRSATKPTFEGPTIRFHIGLEDTEDLKTDLDAGFVRLRATA
jgi:cystathionine beta-lyase